jgi:hypothetical protein
MDARYKSSLRGRTRPPETSATSSDPTDPTDPTGPDGTA